MKIAFFCGAGVESEFNICSGDEFAKSVLSIERNFGQREIYKIIQKHYAEILENCKKSSEHPEWYPDKCYAQPFNIQSLLKNTIKKEWQICQKHSKSIASYEREIKDEAKRISGIKAKRKRIYANPNYMGILDENFHAIISPRAFGPQKFWTVIMAVTRAYIAICTGILDIPMNGRKSNLRKIEQLLNNPNETYKKIIEYIKQPEGKFQKNSYYRIIKEIFVQYGQKVDLISTNYTPIAEEIIGEEINRVAYINGHIKLFESPYYLYKVE